ncbi:MAG: type II secretion system F family protein [Phycisphaerales bacterium]|nr:type II secretion system F family protein [Phycisphaerales bacterium]
MTRAASQIASFFFVAAKPSGGRTFGLRQARSERALAEHLRRDKLVLLQTWRLPGWANPKQRFKARDHAELNTQLSQLLSRGVPLIEALDVAANVVSGRSRPLVAQMREEVASGASFADACRKVGVFDRVTIAVYRAAERSGDLAGAAHQLAVNINRQLRISGKAVTLMIYPAIVMTISVLAGTFMMTFIVPKIGGALKEAGIDLPTYTAVVLAIGLFIQTNWMLVLAALGVALVGAVLARAALGRLIGRFMRVFPGIRDVVMTQELTRFFTVMAAMTRSGIPLADALGIGVEAISHPRLRRDLGQLRTKLIEGGVLRMLVEKVESLPVATRRLLVAADRAGDLETAFDGLADDMADALDRKTERLLSALEPLLIVFMFLFIGSIVMSVMLPMIQLTSQTV